MLVQIVFDENKVCHQQFNILVVPMGNSAVAWRIDIAQHGVFQSAT